MKVSLVIFCKLVEEMKVKIQRKKVVEMRSSASFFS